MFVHQPDGFITVGSIVIPLRNWLKLEPTYTLPEGYVGRQFLPNQHNLLLRADGTLESAPSPTWAEGLLYLSREASYRRTLTAAMRFQDRKLQDTAIEPFSSMENL